MKKEKIISNKVLTKKQKEILLNFKGFELKDRFYLTGGTALSAFYLQHRISEDLDFFSEDNFEVEEIFNFFKKVDKTEDIIFESKYDRRIFFLKYQDSQILKIEFTKYPFKNINTLKTFDGIKVDSLKDILVNKIIAITDREDIKDYIDIYFIFQKYKNLKFEDVIYLAEKKFEIKGINYILQGKFLKNMKFINELMLIKQIEENKFREFFIKKAKQIIKNSVRKEIEK